MTEIPNILADRYASAEMSKIFDPVEKVRLEREFWLAVLETQIELGLEVDATSLADYRRVLNDIDLDSIRERELGTRHDLKARLDEFCALAGHEDLHQGLTSRDVTENVEQLQICQALELLEGRALALLAKIAELAASYAESVVVGRTHNVAAQPTTVGKRFAQFGSELIGGIEQLQYLKNSYSLRGIKGPVGSQQDQLDLLGYPDLVARLEELLAERLGIPAVMNAVGQVYPRSFDMACVSSLSQLSSGPANLALMVRLMAGHDLATEGFKAGQVGSSAMPHKMNTRSCERIAGLAIILKGHLTMASGLAGTQWNEGDVACSVVRRVMIPDAFFAMDGILETSFAVLNEFGLFEAVVAQELEKYLPFMATPTLLLHALRTGMGREVAHEIIKAHAVATALGMRQGDQAEQQSLVQRLASDEAFPGTETELQEIVAGAAKLIGTVDTQIVQFCERVTEMTKDSPASSYRGAQII